MVPSFRKGGMAVNQHHQCRSDVTGVGESGHRLELIPLFTGKGKKFGKNAGKQVHQKQKDDGRRNDRHICPAALVLIHTGKMKHGSTTITVRRL